MTAARNDAGEITFPAELLEQLTEEAHVVAAGDRTEDVALDLYETPFSPTARQRALRWLNCDEYTAAAETYLTLQARTDLDAGSEKPV